MKTFFIFFQSNCRPGNSLPDAIDSNLRVIGELEEKRKHLTDLGNNAEAGETLNANSQIDENDIRAQVSSHITLVPWQNEKTDVPSENKMTFCCIGISPSQFRRLLLSQQKNKNNSPRMATIYAQIALQYTLEQFKIYNGGGQLSVIVLIVDAIQKYNFAVFNNKQLQTGNALKYAMLEGAELHRIFTDAASELTPELTQFVKIIRWQDICNNEYDDHVRMLEAYFQRSEEFSELVNTVVQAYIEARRPRGNFTKEEKSILRQYVLHEIPALIRGVTYNRQHYPVIVHPVLSSAKSMASNNQQRNSMFSLLQYIRDSKELATLFTSQKGETKMCEVYDIEIPAYKPPLSIDMDVQENIG